MIRVLLLIMMAGVSGVAASQPMEEVDVRVTVPVATPPRNCDELVPVTPPVSSYLRKTVPFLLSGSAAIAEIVDQAYSPPLKGVRFAATLLWLGANLAGLINVYLDYRKK